MGLVDLMMLDRRVTVMATALELCGEVVVGEREETWRGCVDRVGLVESDCSPSLDDDLSTR